MPRAILLLFALLDAGCALPPPRALAPGEGWYCAPCSRVAHRVVLTPEAELLGAARDRRRACSRSR